MTRRREEIEKGADEVKPSDALLGRMDEEGSGEETIGVFYAP